VLHVGKESHIIRETIGALEEQLSPATFLRLARSAIVEPRSREGAAVRRPGEHVVILHDGKKLAMTRGLCRWRKS
jgi:two-component system LytT family response regulator